MLIDLGNVLLEWDPAAALGRTMSPGEVTRFFDEADFPALNRRLDAGLTFAAAADELAARDPWLAWALGQYREHYPHALTGGVPGMAELVGELRTAGLRLVGLTNWSAETFPHALPAAPAIGMLDGVVVSGQEGVIKPDRRIYAIAAERYRLDPARTLFVDDAEANVAGGRDAGFLAVRFTDAPALRAELRRLGVDVRP